MQFNAEPRCLLKKMDEHAKYEGEIRFAGLSWRGSFSARSLGSGTFFSSAGILIVLGSQVAAKLFTCYSHPLSSLAASGLRLETWRTCDKRISEVYFPFPSKKFLTENLNRQVNQTSKSHRAERG
jgi:hypothetical protein